MSTMVAVPTPSSASVERRLPRLTRRAKALLTAVNLHFAGVAALTAVCIYLAVHLLFVVQGLHAENDDAMAQQRVTLRAAEVAALPLRGLDAKLVNSTADADQFYRARLPYAYSQVLTELGKVTKVGNVRLARVQYAQQPVLSGTAELIEVRMDVSISGDYRPLVEVINGLERDRMFFLIRQITFTGAQSGAVNLRMQMTTYLRKPTDDEPIEDTPADPNNAAAAAVAGSGGAQ